MAQFGAITDQCLVAKQFASGMDDNIISRNARHVDPGIHFNTVRRWNVNAFFYKGIDVYGFPL
jgi:hypothetical protein